MKLVWSVFPYAVAVGSVALCSLLKYAADPWLPYETSPALGFFAAIIISAWFGYGPAAVAILGSAAAAMVWFTPANPADTGVYTRPLVFAIEAGVVAAAVAQLRASKQGLAKALRQLQTARAREGRLVTSNASLEQKVDEKRRDLESLVTMIPELVWHSDRDGNLLWVNDKWKNYTGLDVSAGADWLRQVADPEDYERLRTERQQCRIEGRNTEIAGRLRNKSGVSHWFMIRAFPPKTLDQGYWIGTAILLDHELAAKEKWQRVLDNIPVAVAVYEVPGYVLTDINSQMADLIGIQQADVQGLRFAETPWMKALPPDHRAKMETALGLATRSEKPYHFESVRYTPGQADPIPAAITLSPVLRGNTVEQIVECAVDLRLVKRLEGQIRQASKMDAIGRLASGIAHDANNHLTVIQSCVEMLEPAIPAAEAEWLHMMRAACQSAGTLTQGLLSVSRLPTSTANLESINLNDLLNGQYKLYRQLLEADLNVNLNLGQDVWPIKADTNTLQNALLNLVVNAKDACTTSGCTISLETKNVIVTPDYAETNVHVAPGEYACLSVSDTGAGMSPEVKERLFEPFFTTKREGKGTGLGLSTVYGIVQQHGGFIHVYSELGEGTTFRLYFPRAEQPKAETVRLVAAPRRKQHDSQYSILVVDDVEPIRRMAVMKLTGAGYDVADAPTPEAALDYARAHPIDLLVADIIMPNLLGPELAGLIRTARPEVKVLYMSGHPERARAYVDQRCAGEDFLAKPFTQTELLIKVQELLEGPTVVPTTR